MQVLIVDDHILFREGLTGLLRSQPDMQVIGECGTMHEAIELALRIKPEVVLMDFSLPDGSGLEATRAILACLPETQIIFLTVHDNDERLIAAMRAGAKGYLLKNLSVSKLLASLRALERGEAAISRTMMARILEEFAQSTPPAASTPSPLIGLTSREIEVLQELADGITNQEIATRLFISEKTVKNNIHNILDKLSLHNRREAIEFARKYGLYPNNNHK
ncbi:MAG: DNA-binding response regulator [Chloroflexi bacterium]|nr:MAG: DNA-binding response regulator [Chloroflexota bacterium]